jgi:branched-subunit amino acid aminotransferase/4-amino-4-deoxychorismate lyase
MDAAFVIRNGETVRKEEACVSVYNKQLFFDFAVYSNIKVVRGRMLFPELEIEKLFQSAVAIGLRHSFTAHELLKWASDLVVVNNLKDALIRILLIGSEAGTNPIIFLFPVGLTFYSRGFYRRGARLVTFQGQRQFPAAKTTNLLLEYLAYREASNKGAIDALLTDGEGNITEGTRCSFFAIKGGVLIAPPRGKVLEGVTRKILFDIAPSVIRVEERDIKLDELQECEEFFITGTTFGLMPIRQIDGIYAKSVAGAKFKELQKKFKEYAGP